MKSILLVEDEDSIRKALKKLLERNRYLVQEANSFTEASTLPLDQFSLIISDVRLPGGEGTSLIAKTKTPVLIMTSYASLRSAVDAMKLGAIDYIAKPFNHEEMLLTVNKILSSSPKTQNDQQLSYPDETQESHYMLGRSMVMKALQHKLNKVAPTNATVMILGESGTGKELVAQAIHHFSARKAMSMVSVNCAAIPETLIESELFGHEKGAFTGATAQRQGLVEAADGSTLFLDEIGELPLEAQARLLRVLQEGEIRRIGSIQTRNVNIRLLTATHRDLKSLVKEGKFREDLFYRLNVVQLNVPPLREREADIMLLANHFINTTSAQLRCEPRPLSDQCKAAMLAYHWPGNVRELENCIERALILNDDQEIHLSDLGIESTLNITENVLEETHPAPGKPCSLDEYFVHFVQTHEHRLTETEIAKRLGISRKNLWERRQKLGIPRKKSKSIEVSD